MVFQNSGLVGSQLALLELLNIKSQLFKPQSS